MSEMDALSQQVVPLGGTRVPESMGGASAVPWRDLPEVTEQQKEDFGEAYDAVLRLRGGMGNYKKKISALAPPMRDCIFNVDSAEHAASLEGALSAVSEEASAVRKALAEGWEKVESASCDVSTREAALAALVETREEASSLEAEVRELCHATLAKAKEGAAESKEIYGDFNLALAIHTRKCFARQQKLLGILKQLKANVTGTAVATNGGPTDLPQQS